MHTIQLYNYVGGGGGGGGGTSQYLRHGGFMQVQLKSVNHLFKVIRMKAHNILHNTIMIITEKNRA